MCSLHTLYLNIYFLIIVSKTWSNRLYSSVFHRFKILLLKLFELISIVTRKVFFFTNSGTFKSIIFCFLSFWNIDASRSQNKYSRIQVFRVLLNNIIISKTSFYWHFFKFLCHIASVPKQMYCKVTSLFFFFCSRAFSSFISNSEWGMG